MLFLYALTPAAAAAATSISIINTAEVTISINCTMDIITSTMYAYTVCFRVSLQTGYLLSPWSQNNPGSGRDQYFFRRSTVIFSTKDQRSLARCT
eukprot:s1093_g7.t1